MFAPVDPPTYPPIAEPSACRALDHTAERLPGLLINPPTALPALLIKLPRK